MAHRGKTFLEKFDSKKEAELKETDDCLMVIPSTKKYDDLMKQVSAGSVTTQNELREFLAIRYKVDFCCPLVTGVFVSIIAGKDEEDMAVQDMSIYQATPYWRTLESGRELNPKYPGGIEAQESKPRKEGHAIELDRNGEPKRVVNYQDVMFKFS